jgi:hypothetical protein
VGGVCAGGVNAFQLCLLYYYFVTLKFRMKHVHIVRPAGAVMRFASDFSTNIYAPLELLGLLKGPEGRNIGRISNEKISKAPEERNMRYAWFKVTK